MYHRAARVGDLPGCNRGFRENLVPYFAPLVAADERGDPWYLGEDYAFCERARRAGVGIYADTTVRLWHVGAYRYGWEDAGREVERFDDYTYRLAAPAVGPAPVPAAPPPAEGYTEDWFSRHVPLWAEMLAPLVGTPCRVLEVGVFEGRSTAWLMEYVLTHPDARLTWVDTFAGGREHAGLDLGGLEGRFGRTPPGGHTRWRATSGEARRCCGGWTPLFSSTTCRSTGRTRRRTYWRTRCCAGRWSSRAGWSASTTMIGGPTRPRSAARNLQ